MYRDYGLPSAEHPPSDSLPFLHLFNWSSKEVCTETTDSLRPSILLQIASPSYTCLIGPLKRYRDYGLPSAEHPPSDSLPFLHLFNWSSKEVCTETTDSRRPSILLQIASPSDTCLIGPLKMYRDYGLPSAEHPPSDRLPFLHLFNWSSKDVQRLRTPVG